MTPQELQKEIDLLTSQEAIRNSQMELNISQQKHTITVSENQIMAAKIQLERFETEQKRAKAEFDVKLKSLSK